MNTSISKNFAALSFSAIILPVFLFLLIFIFLFQNNATNASSYVEIQKNYFYYINTKLSKYSEIQYNFTQMGDALVILSLFSVLFLKAPKLWEALISSSLISLLVTSILKNTFSVPRPAAILDPNSFVIVGKALKAHNSLPSGHAITVFTILTVLFYAFNKNSWPYKITASILLMVIGFTLAFSRVAVGAHFPLDVVIGSVVGYLCGVLGIIFSNRIHLWEWIGNKKYYPIFILIFLA